MGERCVKEKKKEEEEEEVGGVLLQGGRCWLNGSSNPSSPSPTHHN
jgi:hypothetical protein